MFDRTLFRQLPRRASVARSIAPDKLWNPVVSPGCNDSAARHEWMESTQIEPSRQWGDQYLQLTKQNADLFKVAF